MTLTKIACRGKEISERYPTSLTYFGITSKQGLPKKDAKIFGNVIHLPIICDDIENNTPVI